MTNMSEYEGLPYGEEDTDENSSEVLSEEVRLERRIVTTLQIFPKLSPSMLQSALGPHNRAQTWRPVLEKLIREGRILREQKTFRSELGRYRTVIIISLTDYPQSVERVGFGE